MFRNSYRRCSVKKGVLRNFAKFTGKHLWQGLIFNKIAALRLSKCLSLNVTHITDFIPIVSFYTP